MKAVVGRKPSLKKPRNESSEEPFDTQLIDGDLFLAPIFSGADYLGTGAFEVQRVSKGNRNGYYLTAQTVGASTKQLMLNLDEVLAQDTGFIHYCAHSACPLKEKEKEERVHVANLEISTEKDMRQVCGDNFRAFSKKCWRDNFGSDVEEAASGSEGSVERRSKSPTSGSKASGS
jgi:hypothetical protein